ncbi:MAG: LysR family transcriptional regulator [Acidovorax sp.]
MDRLLTMRVFQAVADEGGFAAAARKLDMSPAGVTRLVADLEDHLGARLLQRTTRRVSLTEAGEAYLARVRQILSDVDDAFDVAQAHSEQLSGPLRLLAPPVLAVNILAPLATEFRRLHPHILIEIHVETLMAPPVGNYDITLMGVDEQYDANIIARPIAATEAVVCASPEYLRRRGMPQRPEELTAHDCLLRPRTDARNGVLRLFNPEDGNRAVDVRLAQPVFVSNHLETLLAAALAGAGITGQPVNLVAPYLRDGQLVRVLAPWNVGRYTIYAALPSRKFMPARTRAFLEFLAEHTRMAVREAQQAGVNVIGLTGPESCSAATPRTP